MSINSRIKHEVSTGFIDGMPWGTRIESTLQINAVTVISREWTPNSVEEAKRDNAKQILRQLLDELTKGVLDAT